MFQVELLVKLFMLLLEGSTEQLLEVVSQVTAVDAWETNKDGEEE